MECRPAFRSKKGVDPRLVIGAANFDARSFVGNSHKIGQVQYEHKVRRNLQLVVAVIIGWVNCYNTGLVGVGIDRHHEFIAELEDELAIGNCDYGAAQRRKTAIYIKHESVLRADHGSGESLRRANLPRGASQRHIGGLNVRERHNAVHAILALGHPGRPAEHNAPCLHYERGV